MTLSIPPAAPYSVAVLGATGLVGQRTVALLSDHPWFDLRIVAASRESAGRPYGEVVRWSLGTPLPPRAAELVVASPGAAGSVAVAFSALEASVAAPVERDLADLGVLVVSNARSHRGDPDVPLLVPEVNPDHLALLGRGPGGIIAHPNCSSVGLAMALAPMDRAFGVERVLVTTLQARSGAGMAGLTDEAFAGNVVPLIEGEEEKIERETLEILGHLEGGAVSPAEIDLSAHCNRVDVAEGHTLCVSVALRREATSEEILCAWREFRGPPQELALPGAPERPIEYIDAPDGPQPRLHLGGSGGMALQIGRLRPCPLLGHKFVALSHNTLRGAAGGAVLAAELAVARGLPGRDG